MLGFFDSALGEQIQSSPEAATHWRTRKRAAVLDDRSSAVMRRWQAHLMQLREARGQRFGAGAHGA